MSDTGYKGHSLCESKLIYGRYLKYDMIDQSLPSMFGMSTHDLYEIHIYIDLYDLLYNIYRPSMFIRDPKYITAACVNYAMHMIHYFNSRQHLDLNNIKVILLYSDTTTNTPNAKYCKQYNHRFAYMIENNVEKYKQVRKALQDIKNIVRYIPNVYMIDGNAEVSTMILYHAFNSIMSSKGCPGGKDNGVANVIISSQDTMTQLTNKLKNCSVSYVYFSVRDREKKKVSFNNLDCMHHLMIKNRKSPAAIGTLTPEYISLLQTLIGMRSREIPALYSIKTAAKIMKKIPSSFYSKGNLDTERAYKVIADLAYTSLSDNIISYDIFKNRFKAIDLWYQYNEFKYCPESVDRSFLNKSDSIQDLVQLNYQLFQGEDADEAIKLNYINCI